MYANGTQKKHWTFGSADEVKRMRVDANESLKAKYRPVLETPEQEGEFLTPQEEALLSRIITDAGIRFGDEFKPAMWPSVRWIAFAYFKRFYLHHSMMEFFPKNVMMTCYYLAAKIDEFNITIDNFADNLRSGARESNIESILALEPELMLHLNYHFTVHTPYRPFEGHIIEMKTKLAPGQLDFDLEKIRPSSMQFLKKSLIGDAMLLYAPSHLALAAIKHGLEKLEKPLSVLHDYLFRLMEIDAAAPGTDEVALVEKMLLRLEEICQLVEEQSASVVEDKASKELQERMSRAIALQSKLDALLKTSAADMMESVDSDDD